MTKQEEKSLSSNLLPVTKTGLTNPIHARRNYEIHVQGHLSEIWSDWFEGLTIEQLDDDEMILSGTIIDQSALMGVLNKINRLNLTLLCVQSMDRKK